MARRRTIIPRQGLRGGVPRAPRHLVLLYHAQEGRCGSCGLPFEFIGWLHKPDEQLSQDHVIPKARGGPDVLENKLAMHVRSNNAKADRLPNGCERIMHDLVLSVLGLNPIDARDLFAGAGKAIVLRDNTPNPAMADALRAALGE